MKRILSASLSTLIVVISLTLPLSRPVKARIYSLQPTNEDSGPPTDQFTTADPIFAIFSADIEGGEICVVDANGGASHCKTISSFVGTGWTLIAPGLPPGTYRLRASDNDPSYSVFSFPFTVTQCDANDPACSAQRRMSDQTVAEWKENAGRSFTGFGEMCSTLEVAGSFKKPKVGRGFLFAKKAADDVNQQQKNWGWEGALLVVGAGYALGFTVTANVTAAQQFKPYLALVKEVTCGAQQMYKDIVDDPPDSDYTTLAQPVFTQLPATGDVINDRLALSLDRKQAFGRAQLKSYERYLGAVAAGDEAAIRLQAQAIADYGQSLTAEMKESAAALRAWGAAQSADSDINDPAVTQAELEAASNVFERVRTSGFTQDEINQLSTAGLSQDEIDRIRADYNRDLNRARTGVSLQTIANDTAAALEASIDGFNGFSQEAAWVANGRAPKAVSLAPASASLSVGATHTVSANVTDARTAPVAGIKVTLKVTGANPATLVATTDASGTATFSYTGNNTGDDTLSATAWTTASNVATVNWSAGPVNALPSVHGRDAGVAEGNGSQFWFDFTDADTQDTHTVTIDWGDGSPPTTSNASDGSVYFQDSTGSGSGLLIAFHTYADDGLYHPRATVTDNHGGAGSGGSNVEVRNLDPVPGVVTLQEENGEIVFRGDFSDPGVRDTHTAEINWGDGANGPALLTEVGGAGYAVGRHAYGAPGQYTIILTLRDDDGGTASRSTGLTVGNGGLGNSSPVLQLSNYITFEGGGSFSAAFTDPDSLDTHTGTIDWGDGSPIESLFVQDRGGSGIVFANHSYADDGQFTLTVTLTDNHGGVASGVAPMNVQNAAPQVFPVGFTTSNRLFKPGDTITAATSFFDSGSRDRHTAVWDWGDGTTTPAVFTETGGTVTLYESHTYTAPGVYLVKLIVTDDDGATGTGNGIETIGFYPTVTEGSIKPVVTETGKISTSISGLGIIEHDGVLKVEKPAGATVRRAFMAAASRGFFRYILLPGDVKLEGVAVSWEIATPSGIQAYNFWGEVTDIVKAKIDASPAGQIDLALREENSNMSEGEVLIVIFDDPNQVKDNTVALLFGAQQTEGDRFALRFAQPIDKSDPNFSLTMSLGISFGHQGDAQYSIVDVNGQRVTTSAGGEDDGEVANGALLTVGGVGDDPSNPTDPQALPTAGPRSDDELYDLLPFVKTGDTSLDVETRNPSNDDNIFFSAFVLKGAAAVVGEGVVVSPVSASNPVGSEHTLTATAQDSQGRLIAGRSLTFEVVSGPHAGLSGNTVTDAQGVARFTYTGTSAGTDSIVARFTNSAGQAQNSNAVTATWNTPASLTTTLSAKPSTGTYGETTELSATLTSGGAPLGDKDVSFSLNGVSVGVARTDSDGVARLSNVSLAGINAGMYASALNASFAGGGGYAASASSSSLIVLKAGQTIAFAPLSSKTFGDSPFSLSAQASSGLPVSFTASGNCAITGDTLTMTGIGACTVTASQGGNANYNAAPDVTRAFSITGKTATTLTVSAASAQYSDVVSLTASVTPYTYGGQSLAGTVQFALDGTTLGSAAINSNGVAALPPMIINRAPGSYSVTASLLSTNASFSNSSGSTTLTVGQEDARALYTGALFINTASQKSSTVTVTSSATVQDITAVEPLADPNAGDIRNAKVTFVDRNTGLPLCSATVVLASSQDIKTGTASCTWTANLGSEASVQYTVGTIVGGYYTRDTSADDALVTISRATDGGVTGGGFLVLRNSSGQAASEPGAKVNFGFNAKSRNANSGPKGNVNIIVRSGGRVYQVKSREVSQLIVSGNKATIIAAANIQDITEPRRPITISSDATLELVVKDSGEPGLNDTIAITIRNSAGGLWFSSSWNGAKTIEQRLDGGNIQVRD